MHMLDRTLTQVVVGHSLSATTEGIHKLSTGKLISRRPTNGTCNAKAAAITGYESISSGGSPWGEEGCIRMDGEGWRGKGRALRHCHDGFISYCLNIDTQVLCVSCYVRTLASILYVIVWTLASILFHVDICSKKALFMLSSCVF